MLKTHYSLFLAVYRLRFSQIGGQASISVLNLAQSPRQAALGGGKSSYSCDYDVDKRFITQRINANIQSIIS